MYNIPTAIVWQVILSYEFSGRNSMLFTWIESKLFCSWLEEVGSAVSSETSSSLDSG
jgi:hypothetical protein